MRKNVKIVREARDLPTQLVGNTFAFDTETTDTNYDVLETIGVSLSDGTLSWYIPVKDIGGTIDYPLIISFLKCLFGNRKSVAIAHNAKFDLKVLRKMGVEARCTVEDTLLASWLLDERSGRHGLKYLGREILKDDPPELSFSSYTAEDYAYNRIKTKKTATSCTRWNIKLAEYACVDALNTYRLWDWWFRHKLKEFTSLYEEMEKPTMRMLLDMETAGATLDKSLLSLYREEIEHERIPVLQQEIKEMTWESFNINSNRDMQTMLFKKLKLRPLKKTSTGQPSVDKEVLEYYSEELFTSKVLEFRALEKLLNTYIIPLLNVSGDKVYCNFNQTTCVTGDTLVYTEKGLLPISLYTTGEILNRYSTGEVPSHFYKFNDKKVKTIKTRLGYTITGTIEHPIIVNEYSSSDILNNKDSCRYKNKYKTDGIWKKLGELTTEDYVAIKYGNNCFATTYVQLGHPVLTTHTNSKPVIFPNVLDEPLAELLGMYFADGSIHDSNKSFSLRFSNRDKEVQNRICELSKSIFGISAAVSESGGSTSVTSINLSYLEEELELKRKCYNKIIPSKILKSPRSVVLAFLRGMTLDSSIAKKGKDTALRIVVANEEAARVLQTMLLNLGIVAGRTSGTGHWWTVSVYNRYYEKFKDIVGFIQSKKYIEGPYGGNHLYIDEERKIVWLRVTNIEEGIENVYDFTMPITHSFISNGFISHNTVTGRLCVSRDTLVEAPRDLLFYPEGVPITELKEGDLVYSYTWDRRLCLRKIKWVGRTGYKPTVTIRAKGENGDIVELRLTSDHLVRMYDGRWQAAGYLKPGNRLMCMVRREVSEGYARFFPSSRRRNKNNPSSTTGGKIREHRYIVAQMQGLDNLPSKWVVHHKDGNTLNNHPSNLEQIMHSNHKKMHRPKTTPEQVQDMLDGASLTIHPGTLKRLAREYGLAPTNHTVIDITHNEAEEVWDLEVDDTHTFIANGIAIHNSSSEPNLQNIPAAGDEFNIRKAFIPSPGNKLIVADYNSLELRVLAHFISESYVGHSYLCEAFEKDLDAHKYMASVLYDIPYDDVSPEQRKAAKSTTFGIIYGMGPRKLGKELKIKMKEAQEFLRHYYDTFPEIKLMQTMALDSATKQGYVNTLYGHRRRFYTPKDSPQTQALNALVQGSAAEIVKLAQVEMGKKLPPGCRQIIQVHDEVVVDVPEEKVDAAVEVVKEAMEQTVKLNLDLKTDPKVVNCWADAK